MSMNQARFGLLGVFVGSLILQLTAFIVTRDKMWPEELLPLILKLLAIYSVQLGVVLGGIFAQPKVSLSDPPPILAWTAIILATVWNALLIERSLSFSFAQQDSVSALSGYLDAISSASSFLVAGMLVFFFGKAIQPPD